MPRLRMIGRVHRNGVIIVVAGDVRADAQRVVHGGGDAAATGKEIDKDFRVPVQLVLQARVGADGRALRLHGDCRLALRNAKRACLPGRNAILP